MKNLELIVSTSLVIALIYVANQFSVYGPLALVALLLIAEVYLFIVLKDFVLKDHTWWYAIGFVSFFIFTVFGIIQLAVFNQTTSLGILKWLRNFYFGIAITIVVCKLFLTFLFGIQDIVRVIQWAFQSAVAQEYHSPKRRQFLANVSMALALVPFTSMLYGILKGRYKYTIERLKLSFGNLPKAFDGFTVVQISDVHSGSWDQMEEVRKGIDMIKELKPDLIVFTGDLVNKFKDEINPFIDMFSELNAPYGKFAILGNHDYWGDEEQKVSDNEYWRDFKSKFHQMGFKLLLNENVKIEKDGEFFRLLGVENWGASKWFPKEGDLDKALNGVSNEEFCVLLSHDPTHWDEKVLPHARKIDLTLSGHTHGMQFGIKYKNYQWSPVGYKYQKWAGLYTEQDQHIYINKGFGYLAFPGRLGMWPEITVLELSRVDA